MATRVVVGMSGGVDSTVAAHLLLQQGFDVIGVYMKNWEDDTAAAYRDDQGVGCSWEQDMADVRSACDQLGIPFLTFNFVKEYKELVFSEFVKELEVGRTPNPDILCNQEIKFRCFLEKALQLPDVDMVATGHYAKIADGKLLRPADRNKDQTYFLYRMPRMALSKTLFPLSDLTKDQVREIAIAEGFVNAEKKDSTGICFIGDIDYRSFVNQYIQKKPGEIQDMNGEVIGEHQGLHLYTIGQRKGIEIGGTGPYYVTKKDLERNVLIVTNEVDDKALFADECTVNQMHWLSSTPEPGFALSGHVQVRYRQEAQSAKVFWDGQLLRVIFDEPQRAVTPGQSAVIYNGDQVLGGGIIDEIT